MTRLPNHHDPLGAFFLACAIIFCAGVPLVLMVGAVWQRVN